MHACIIKTFLLLILSMERVSFSDWKKLDLRTAKIVSVEDIAGKDKLFKLEVDIGDEKRVLVAGLKGHYSKEDLFGKQVIVFANLEPKKLAGTESNGMLLAASENGKPVLLTTDKKTENGLKVE